MPKLAVTKLGEGGGLYRVGDIGAFRLVEQGDGGVGLGGEDVDQCVAVTVQRYAGTRLQQLPVERAQNAHLR